MIVRNPYYNNSIAISKLLDVPNPLKDNPTGGDDGVGLENQHGERRVAGGIIRSGGGGIRFGKRGSDGPGLYGNQRGHHPSACRGALWLRPFAQEAHGGTHRPGRCAVLHRHAFGTDFQRMIYTKCEKDSHLRG